MSYQEDAIDALQLHPVTFITEKLLCIYILWCISTEICKYCGKCPKCPQRRCNSSRCLHPACCSPPHMLRWKFGGVALAQLPFSLQATCCEFMANTTSFILLIVRNACVEHADLVTVSSISVCCWGALLVFRCCYPYARCTPCSCST